MKGIAAIVLGCLFVSAAASGAGKDKQGGGSKRFLGGGVGGGFHGGRPFGGSGLGGAGIPGTGIHGGGGILGSGVVGAGIPGAGIHGGGVGIPGSGLVGAGIPGAGFPLSSSSGASECRYWCKTPEGQAYCCETAYEPEAPVGTKPLACPDVRPTCPHLLRSQRPITCSNDFKCVGADKCCFDRCLGEHVCKPPSIFGGHFPF